MTKPLDHIHHIAIPIKDIELSVTWYTSLFDCEVPYRDDNCALFKFDKIPLA
jgi:catechol 2,3-dioxygenase-like lactoylglutathione lyase family enzyme